MTGTHDTPVSALDCRFGFDSHRFDPFSGWCQRGCGVRDDGRVVNRAGVVILPGPTYTADALAAHAADLASGLDRPTDHDTTHDRHQPFGQ